MPSFRTTRRVKHSAPKMFDLVADVEQYPEFLPLCQSLAVRRRSTMPDGREVLVADMRVGYKAIRESFTSRVTLDREKMSILVEYIDGPFRALENRWVFRDDPSAPALGAAGEGAAHRSAIEFFIKYEFKSRMFGMLMGSMFDAAFRRFAEAFEHRANEVYG
jgi:coenzyme Q-binding protein COQ10